MNHVETAIQSIRSVSDLKKVKKMNLGTVRFISGNDVIEMTVRGIPESDSNKITELCVRPSPPKKRRVVKNEKGQPMVDPKTKTTLYEEYEDSLDSSYVASCSRIDRLKSLMTAVEGLVLDWGKDSTLDDKINFVSDNFTSSEISDIIMKTYELGSKLPEEVEAEKNDSDPIQQEKESGAVQ